MIKTATASNSTARISRKDSITLFKNIRRKPVRKAKRLLNDLLEEKRNIDGRYFTKASKEILGLIESAERNAEAKGLDTEKLLIKEAKAEHSFRFYLPKSRYSHRGKRAKICQLSMTLIEG